MLLLRGSNHTFTGAHSVISILPVGEYWMEISSCVSFGRIRIEKTSSDRFLRAVHRGTYFKMYYHSYLQVWKYLFHLIRLRTNPVQNLLDTVLK